MKLTLQRKDQYFILQTVNEFGDQQLQSTPIQFNNRQIELTDVFMDHNISNFVTALDKAIEIHIETYDDNEYQFDWIDTWYEWKAMNIHKTTSIQKLHDIISPTVLTQTSSFRAIIDSIQSQLPVFQDVLSDISIMQDSVIVMQPNNQKFTFSILICG